MTWAQAFTIIAAVAAIIGLQSFWVAHALSAVREDIRTVREDIRNVRADFDRRLDRIEARLDRLEDRAHT
jgi:hypothetical protein